MKMVLLMQKKWMIGMYQRLSADEGEEESNSVKNQKILMDYY